ncbi:AtpZ/AtpI family protein [candidate division KSB1 bacterium]|nr:AtpZ/AtpI family protein [candidate division KSB1 bacterium]
MITNDSEQQNQPQKKFSAQVGSKEKRKQRALEDKKNDTVWFGLGMFGLVGWAVTLPTLIFLAIGIWLDATWPGRISWTLTFLFVGIVVGCFNGWYWVKRESRHDES